jgi:hypothetical protein
VLKSTSSHLDLAKRVYFRSAFPAPPDGVGKSFRFISNCLMREFAFGIAIIVNRGDLAESAFGLFEFLRHRHAGQLVVKLYRGIFREVAILLHQKADFIAALISRLIAPKPKAVALENRKARVFIFAEGRTAKPLWFAREPQATPKFRQRQHRLTARN